MHGQLPIAWSKAKDFNIYDIAEISLLILLQQYLSQMLGTQMKELRNIFIEHLNQI